MGRNVYQWFTTAQWTISANSDNPTPHSVHWLVFSWFTYQFRLLFAKCTLLAIYCCRCDCFSVCVLLWLIVIDAEVLALHSVAIQTTLSFLFNSFCSFLKHIYTRQHHPILQVMLFLYLFLSCLWWWCGIHVYCISYRIMFTFLLYCNVHYWLIEFVYLNWINYQY